MITNKKVGIEVEAKVSGFDQIANKLLRAIGGINSAVTRMQTQMNSSFKNLGTNLGKNMADALVKAFDQKVTGIKSTVTRSLPQSLVKQVKNYAIGSLGVEPQKTLKWMNDKTQGKSLTDQKKYWTSYLEVQKAEDLWLKQAYKNEAKLSKLGTTSKQKATSKSKSKDIFDNFIPFTPMSFKDELKRRSDDMKNSMRDAKQTLDMLASTSDKTFGKISDPKIKPLSVATLIPLTSDRIQTLKDRMEVEATGLYKTYTQKSIDIVKKVREFNAKKQILATPSGGDKGWFDTLFPKSVNDIDPFAIYPKIMQDKIKNYLGSVKKTTTPAVKNPRAGQMGLIAPLAVGVLGALGTGVQMAGGMARGAATAMSSGFGIPATQQTNIMSTTKDAMIDLKSSLQDLTTAGWDMASHAADKFFGIIKIGTGIAFTMLGMLGGSAYVFKSWGQDILMTTERFRGYNIAMLGTLKTQANVDQVMAASMKIAENLPIGYEQIISGTKAMTLISPLKTMFKDSAHLEENMKDVWDIVIALSQIEPEWGIQGALYSLRETLSGDFMSIKRRYEIPVDVMMTTDGKSLSSIKKDVPKLLKGLAGNLRDLVPAETLKLTAGQLGPVLQKIQGQFDVLKTKIGNMGFYDSFVKDVKKVQDEFESFSNSIGAMVFAKRMSNAFESGWEVVKDFIFKTTNAINSLFGTKITIDLSSITENITTVAEGLVNIFQYIQGFLFSSAFQSGMKNTFGYLVTGAQEFYDVSKNIIPKVGKILSDLFISAKNLFQYIRTSTKGFLSDTQLVEIALGVWVLGFGNILSVARSLFGVLGSIVAFKTPIVEIFTWLHKDLKFGGLTSLLLQLRIFNVSSLTNGFLLMLKSVSGIYAIFVLIPNLIQKMMDNFDLFEMTGLGRAYDWVKDKSGIGTPSATYIAEKKDKEYTNLKNLMPYQLVNGVQTKIEGMPSSFQELLLKMKGPTSDPETFLNSVEDGIRKYYNDPYGSGRPRKYTSEEQDANEIQTQLTANQFRKEARLLTSDMTLEQYLDLQRKASLHFMAIATKERTGFDNSEIKTPIDLMNNLYGQLKDSAVRPIDATKSITSVVNGVGKELLGVAKPVGDAIGEAVVDKLRSIDFYDYQKIPVVAGQNVNLSEFKQPTLKALYSVSEQMKLAFGDKYDARVFSAKDKTHTGKDHPLNLATDVQALSGNQDLYKLQQTFEIIAKIGENAGLKTIMMGHGLQNKESEIAFANAQKNSPWARNNMRFETFEESKNSHSLHYGFYGENQTPETVAADTARKAHEEALKAINTKPLITEAEINSRIAAFYLQTQNDKASGIKTSGLLLNSFNNVFKQPDPGKALRDTFTPGDENQKWGKSLANEIFSNAQGELGNIVGSAIREKIGEALLNISNETISDSSFNLSAVARAIRAVSYVKDGIGYISKELPKVATFEDYTDYFLSESTLSNKFDIRSRGMAATKSLPEIFANPTNPSGYVNSLYDQINAENEIRENRAIDIERRSRVSTLRNITPEKSQYMSMKKSKYGESLNFEQYQKFYDTLGEYGETTSARISDMIVKNIANAYASIDNLKFPNLGQTFSDEFAKIISDSANAGISIEEGITKKIKDLKEEMYNAEYEGKNDIFDELFELSKALKKLYDTNKKLNPFQSWQMELERFNVKLKGSDFRIPSVMKELLAKAPNREAKVSVYGAIEKGIEEGQYSEMDALQLGMGASVAALKTWKEQIFDAGKTIADGLASTFETGFFDFMTGKLADLNTMFRTIGRSILSNIGQIISKMMAVSATKMVFGVDVNTGQMSGGGIANSIIGGIFGGTSNTGYNFSNEEEASNFSRLTKAGMSANEAYQRSVSGTNSAKSTGLLGTLGSAWAGAKAFNAANPAVLPLALATGFLSQPGRLWGGAKDDTQAGLAAYQNASSSRDTMVARRSTDAEKYMMSGRSNTIGNYGFGSPTYSTWSSGDGWFKGPNENHSATNTTAFDESMKSYYDLLKTAAEESYNNTKKLNDLKKNNEIAALEQETTYRKDYLSVIQGMFSSAITSGDYKAQDDLRDKVWDMQTTIDDLITQTTEAYKAMAESVKQIKTDTVSFFTKLIDYKYVKAGTIGKLSNLISGDYSTSNGNPTLRDQTKTSYAQQILDIGKLATDAAQNVVMKYNTNSNDGYLSFKNQFSEFTDLQDYMTRSIIPTATPDQIMGENGYSPYTVDNADLKDLATALTDAMTRKLQYENTILNTADNMSQKTMFGRKDSIKDSYSEISRLQAALGSGMFDPNDFKYGGAQAIADANLKISEYYTTIANQLSSWVDSGLLTKGVETLINVTDQAAFEALQIQVNKKTFNNEILSDIKGYSSWKELSPVLAEWKLAGGDIAAYNPGLKSSGMQNSDLGGNIGSSPYAVGYADPFTAYFENMKTQIQTKIQNSTMNGTDYFNAQEELFQLMQEKAEYLKAKSEDSMKALEDMLGAIGDTMKLRIAEEMKTSKGDVIFMDVRSTGDMAKEISAGVKNNDPKVIELIKELKKKLAGF